MVTMTVICFLLKPPLHFTCTHHAYTCTPVSDEDKGGYQECTHIIRLAGVLAWCVLLITCCATARVYDYRLTLMNDIVANRQNGNAAAPNNIEFHVLSFLKHGTT